jgi:hypothetical protein
MHWRQPHRDGRTDTMSHFHSRIQRSAAPSADTIVSRADTRWPRLVHLFDQSSIHWSLQLLCARLFYRLLHTIQNHYVCYHIQSINKAVPELNYEPRYEVWGN